MIPHLLKRISANSSNGLMQFAEQKKPPRVNPPAAIFLPFDNHRIESRIIQDLYPLFCVRFLAE